VAGGSVLVRGGLRLLAVLVLRLLLWLLGFVLVLVLLLRGGA
jgi:hypothetical protein